VFLNTFKTEHVQKEEIKVYIVPGYLLYLAITLAVTVWVARSLHRNGALFLVDAFGGNADLAASVNHLLVVGFYLVNVGYVMWMLRTWNELLTARQMIEYISDKVGVVLVVLGIMHLFNLYVLSRIRKSGSAQVVTHG
jgi:H+/Cl- antiporter ClcA